MGDCMINVKVKLITEGVNKGDSIELDTVTLDTSSLIELVVDHTETNVLLLLIKKRLMHNASKKTSTNLHERELKNFLNAIKDEAA